jgi:hypothetical protein
MVEGRMGNKLDLLIFIVPETSMLDSDKFDFSIPQKSKERATAEESELVHHLRTPPYIPVLQCHGAPQPFEAFMTTGGTKAVTKLCLSLM